MSRNKSRYRVEIEDIIRKRQLRNQQEAATDSENVCDRRLHQYLDHYKQRPAENSIEFWRKLVEENYDPRSWYRWCVSAYGENGEYAPVGQCLICQTISGNAFEVPYKALARLNYLKYSRGGGVVDEDLYLGSPREGKDAEGNMWLEYDRAIHESVYAHFGVFHEGKLRIIFNPELKILSWEFCARGHEIMLLSFHDLGFTTIYVMYLLTAEVVNSMTDLMDLCTGNNVGPMEGLRSYCQRNNNRTTLSGSPALPVRQNSVYSEPPPPSSFHDNNSNQLPFPPFHGIPGESSQQNMIQQTQNMTSGGLAGHSSNNDFGEFQEYVDYLASGGRPDIGS